MGWERYRRSGKYGFGAVLAFGRHNSIRLTAAARDDFDLEHYRYAVLFFDPIRGVVGLRPTTQTSAWGLRMHWQRSRGEISGGGFCRRFGIRPDMGRHHALKKDEESGLLVAQLEDWEWEQPAFDGKGEE